jgi:hypothetical protein
MDADCVSTLLESRPDWPVAAESIFDVPTQELLDCAGSRRATSISWLADRLASRSQRLATGLMGTPDA